MDVVGGESERLDEEEGCVFQSGKLVEGGAGGRVFRSAALVGRLSVMPKVREMQKDFVVTWYATVCKRVIGVKADAVRLAG